MSLIRVGTRAQPANERLSDFVPEGELATKIYVVSATWCVASPSDPANIRP